MTLPQGDEYHQAVQAPQLCFKDAELCRAEVETTVLGLPKPYSGGFTTTYQLQGAKNWAVRCFTRELQDLQARYQAIAAFMQRHALPFLLDAKYLENGICVNGAYYPVIKMNWLNGDSLNMYVAKHLHQPNTLKKLLNTFVQLVHSLEQYQLAHGDLQHGNILVYEEELYLIDYDGMYLPELQQYPAQEIGHPNYQHPARTHQDYSPMMDRFSILVIYTALKALCVAPELWRQFDNGENLLFKARDFKAPDNALLFKALMQYPSLRILAESLKNICALPISEVPSLLAFKRGDFASSSAYPSLNGMDMPQLMQNIGEKVTVVFKMGSVRLGTSNEFAIVESAEPASVGFRLILWSDEVAALSEQGKVLHDGGIVHENVDYSWISATGTLTIFKAQPQMMLEDAALIRLFVDESTALKSTQKKVPHSAKMLPIKISKKEHIPVSEEAFWNHYYQHQPLDMPSASFPPPQYNYGATPPVSQAPLKRKVGVLVIMGVAILISLALGNPVALVTGFLVSVGMLFLD